MYLRVVPRLGMLDSLVSPMLLELNFIDEIANQIKTINTE